MQSLKSEGCFQEGMGEGRSGRINRHCHPNVFLSLLNPLSGG